MNAALNIKNWDEGGNNYVLKGNPKNKWAGFQKTVLFKLSEAFGDDFNIIIWTDKEKESDYYCIPYKSVKHLFTEEHKTTGKYPNRWTAIILDHQFLMHSNANLAISIEHYYAQPLLLQQKIALEDDFFIENAKAEINIRLGQSKFRKGVLKNFDNKCALSQISEASLLTASHIIPWSHRKEFRGDISNGICLYIEYDGLFDKGFITFSDDLELIITSDLSKLSNELKNKLTCLAGKRLSQPSIKELNTEYLRYHRAHIFKN